MLPFNPRQELPSNRITEETHSLSPAGSVKFRLIVPNYSPFYRAELIVKNGTKVLKEGVDFYLTHKFLTGTHITARPMHGSIYIVNESLAGNIKVSYDSLGGDYLIGSNTPPTQDTDPTKLLWEDIIGDLPFPPVHITFDIEKDEWQGEAEHNASVKELADAIEGRDPTEQELHNFLLDRILRLEAIFEDAQAVAHIANKNNPHNATAWQTRSLDKDANARDTALAFGRDLQALAAYINNLNLPAAELNKYVKLANQNTMTGSIQYRNGQFSLLSKDGRAAINFSDDAANLIATNDIIMEAGSDGTGNLTLNIGNQALTVGSSEDAKFNDILIATVDNSADLGSDQIDHERLKVKTSNTDTLHWTGDGSKDKPLTATIITTDATDKDFGVVKLATKSLTLNDPKLAATPWHIQQLEGIFDGKVSADIMVNGKLLAINPVLRKGDAEIGLGNVQNVSDEDMPAGSVNRTLLEDKSTMDHGHDLDEVALPIASETVKGIGLVTPDITEGVKDQAIDRQVEVQLAEALEAAKQRSSNLFPVGVLKIDAYGDNTYLPAPVTGSFKNPSSYWLSMPVIRENNYMTMLRLGRDNDGSGLMLSYSEIDGEDKISTMINTVSEYRPTFMTFEDYITAVVGGSEEYFLFRVYTPSLNVTRTYIAKTNGTMDIRKHIYVEVNAGTTPIDQYTLMTSDGDTIYICRPDVNYYNRVVIPADYWINGQGGNMPAIQDFKGLLKGNNNNGDPFATHGFVTRGYTHSTDNNYAVSDPHQQYGNVSSYGPSSCIYAENGKLYIKSGGDYGLRGGIHPNRNIGLVWFAEVDLTTLTASFVAGTKTKINIDDQGNPDWDGQPQWRRDAFGATVSGSASNNRCMSMVAGGYQYNFINHVGTTTLNEVRLIGGATGAAFFDPYNETIETTSQRHVTVEGPTYDGYIKPFYGMAIGPKDAAGNETLFARGDNDSRIFYAQTKGWGSDGFQPTGFRVKHDATDFLNIGWGQVPYCKEATGRTADISFMYMSTYRRILEQGSTDAQGNVTAGKQYTASTAENDKLRNKLIEIAAEGYASPVTKLEYILMYSPASKARFIKTTAIYDDGRMTADIIAAPANLVALSGDAITFNISGAFTTLHRYDWLPTVSRKYTSISQTSCRMQGFVTEWANGDTTCHMPSVYHGYSPSSASSTAVACFVNMTGSAVAEAGVVRSVTAPVWAYDAFLLCDWGRPYRVKYDSAQIGLIAYDTMPTFAHARDGELSTSGLPARRIFNMLHDESWQVSFYAEKRLILNGVEYMMPIANYDLSTLPIYRNTTLYIFAELIDDTTVYNFYESPSSPNPGVQIGYVRTSTNKIELIQIDYSVSLGMFRELERHIADYDDPHGILGSGAEDIGLGNLSNLPMKHELTQVDFSEIFNDWYRFSHGESGGYPNNASELQSWVYVPETDTIYTPLNSASYIGFVSEIGYGDYSFETVVGTYTSNTDNDSMTVVLAFVKDDAGKEHTLSVVRAGSKEAHLFPGGVGSTFSIWYNYKQADQVQLVGTESTYAEDLGGWGLRECTVKATRKGADWVVSSTPISSQANPSKVEHTLTLVGSSFPALAVFNGAVRIGYGCLSQPQSSFKNLRRPDTDITASYASREMVQGIVDEQGSPPLVVFGTVAVGAAIPIPSGYTQAQCTVVPILDWVSNSNGITGWDIGVNASMVATNQTFGTSGGNSLSKMDYILYCQK